MATRTLFCDPPQEAISIAPALAPARRRQDLMLSIVFLVLIGLPLAIDLLGVDVATATSENRRLTPFPGLERSWSSIASFGSRLRLYFEDNFGLRAQLVRDHALLDAKVLGISPSPTVLWGQDGWLFYADDGGTDDIIADAPFSHAELELWRTTLVDNRDWLRERGIEYVFALAPDKHVIYPEYLPASIHRIGERTRLDQLAAYLRAHTDLVVVDLKTALLDAKPEVRLYDRTDTHWNQRGAYVGYRAIMNAVAARVPGVEPPWPLTDFTPRRDITAGKDLAIMLGLSDVLLEEDLTLMPRRARQARVVDPPHPSPNGDEGRLATEIPGSTLPRAVIFRDSFTSRMYRYLSEHFSRTLYLWQNDVDLDHVLEEKPAVVIHEIVGRHLTTLVPWNAVAASRRESGTRPKT